MTAFLADCPNTGEPLRIVLILCDDEPADLVLTTTRLRCRHCHEFHQFDKHQLRQEAAAIDRADSLRLSSGHDYQSSIAP